MNSSRGRALPGANVVLAASLSVTIMLTACSSSGSGPGGETTCKEWVALDSKLTAEERLFEGKVNEEQQAILKNMLSDHGKSTGETNRINAEWAIIEFCSPDDTGTRPNLNRPIEDAFDW